MYKSIDYWRLVRPWLKRRREASVESCRSEKNILVERNSTSLQATQDAFDKIYRQDLWALRSGEYGSEKPGMESEQGRNARLTALIQDFVRLNDVKSVVEFGCGYFGYASEVDWTGIDYDGFDVVEEVIETNRRNHGRANVRFHVVRDGTRIPKADLLISKDVLQHLPTEDVQYYLSLFQSNFRFMLIGNDSYPDANLNGNTSYGGYRALRLERPPFNYPNIVVQQWKCVEFGAFIVKNFCLLQGRPETGSPEGIILRDGAGRQAEPDRHAHVRAIVGLQDFHLGGWANRETGELFEGFRISASDTVVDVGCGEGAFTSFAARTGAAVVFMDIDAEKVGRATHLIRANAARATMPIVSDCNPIPLPDGTATRVICTEVLEHVHDADALMAEMVRIGMPGAQYLFTMPHPFGEGLQRLLAPGEYFEPPNHLRVFGRNDFEELVRSNGLVVDRWHADGFYWMLHSAMVWSCDPGNKPHPTLDAWAECWSTMLQTKDGRRVKAALDAAGPNRQLVLAHKPAV